jgi:hypothetical protein
MPTEVEAWDEEAVSAEMTLPRRGLRPSVEDARECAARLADMLARLGAHADDAERYRFRVAEALAGSIRDDLEGVTHRGRNPREEEENVRYFAPRPDRSIEAVGRRRHSSF